MNPNSSITQIKFQRDAAFARRGRGHNIDPRMALHHRKIDLAQCDDIAEEGPIMTSHSLTRMQEKVLP